MSLLKSALTVSGLTLVSRVTGVIRDMLIARFFGASAETDAFYVAFRLPNMLRRLFAEGAFQQAFVPMLADVKERSEGEAGTFIDHVFTVLALSVFAASILGVVAAPLLVCDRERSCVGPRGLRPRERAHPLHVPLHRLHGAHGACRFRPQHLEALLRCRR